MRITPKCDIMFNDQEKHISKGVILMISITEVARFRQQVIKYSLKNGVTKASIRYRVSRNSIYRWRKRYDGTWQSLKDRWCYVKITDTLNLCFLVKSAKCTNWSHLFHGLLDNEPLMA